MIAGGTSGADERTAQFVAFVTQHGAGLDRLAYFMVGDEHLAQDLAAEVLLTVWRQWDRVQTTDFPAAYVRRIMFNQAAGHFRRRSRERRGLEQLKAMASSSVHDPDGATVRDVRSALLRLPPRRRACLVLRYAFDLTEREVSETLGIKVGTVKSQTSKAVIQFRKEIGEDFPGISGGLDPDTPERMTSGRRNHGR